MKWYKVKSLAVSGLKNKIYRSGDTVNENNFPPGTATKLAAEGHLELIKEDESEVVDQNGQPEFISKIPLTIDQVTISRMKTELKAANVNFPSNASKAELFEIWSKL